MVSHHMEVHTTESPNSHWRAGYRHLLLHTPYTVTDCLSILWLVATVPVFFLLPPIDAIEGYRGLSAISYAAINIAGVAMVLLLRISRSTGALEPTTWTSWMHFVVSDTYVVVMLLLMSHEGSLMSSLIWHGEFFDADVQAVERAVWNCQPSMELHTMIPPVLGEYLMFAYVSWPLVLFVALLALRHGPCDDEQRYVQQTAGILIFTMFICILVSAAYPVQGPRHSLQHLEAEGLGFLSAHIVLFIEDLGMETQLSLPSQSTALAVALWLSSMRFSHCLAGVLTFFIPAMFLATIYAGLNFSFDVLVGMLVGALAFMFALHFVPWLHLQLVRRGELWHGGGCCSLREYDLSQDAELKHAREVDRLISGDMFV